MVALPANAASVPGVSYSSQVASAANTHGQSVHVAGDVSQSGVEALTFSAGYTTPAGTPAVTSSGTTNADWAALVLTDAGLPVTANNVTVILQWMDSENDPNDWWLRNNPLNNGLGSGGGSGFGSYDNLQTAAGYVAQQLTRDDGLFSPIFQALAGNSSTPVTAAAIWNSAWATSHYGYGSSWHAVDVPIVSAPASAW
jgi:hypothetical protein